MMFAIIILVIGFSSIFIQSLLVRELLVVFHGNETSLGIILSFWLFWTGWGSFILSRSAKKIINPASTLCFVQLSFVLAGILEFILIRNLRGLLNLQPGQIIGLWGVCGVSAFILAPFALINGFLFSLCLKLVFVKRGLKSIGDVYSVDAFGDMLGGIAFSFLFVFAFGPLENLCIIAGLNVIIVLISVYVLKTGSFRQKIFIALIGFVFLIFSFFLRPVEEYLVKKEWRGFNLVATKSSVYGHFHLTRYDDTFSLYENGLLAFTFPLRIDCEETVHFAFSQSPSAKRVLIVGEGIKGLLFEVLKYPVSEVYYLELDPELINLLKNYIPDKDQKALNDRRVKIINLEARAFLNRYKGDKFDIILLNTPPPYTAYLNRFYTYEFFKKIKGILNYNGAFSFSLPSKENYLTKELRDLNASIYHTLKMVFPNILLVPGEKIRFIASRASDYLSVDPKVLSRRLKAWGVKTRFVNEFYFQMKLLPWHLEYVNGVLKNYKAVRLNYDFNPITYYYGLNFFSSYFRSPLRHFFTAVSKVRLPVYFIIFSFIWLAVYLIRKKSILSFSAFSMGASGMAAVILSILGFQIVYGYVYHKIGLLGALFMFGLAFGAWLINRRINIIRRGAILYVYFAACAYIFILPYLFKLLAGIPLFLEGLSFLVPFFMGFISGLSFPLINKLYSNDDSRFFKNAGTLYLCDLLGGGACGLFLSLVFIPLYGLFLSSCIMSFLLFLSWLGLFLYLRTE